MRIPSFTAIYFSFKAKGSSFVLFWEHGWACFISLAFAVALGFITVFMYEVPLYSEELSVSCLYGGLNEECFSDVHYYYDYGMGLNEKFKIDPTKYSSLRISVLKDSCKEDCTFCASVDTIAFADPYYMDSIRSIWVKNGNWERYISPKKISPMFFIHEKQGTAPRTYIRDFFPSDVYLLPTERLEGESKFTTVMYESQDSLRMDTAWSIMYYKPSKIRNSFSGGEIEGFRYAGIYNRGNSVKFQLIALSNTYKPALYSLHDISQGYFQYKLDFPTTRRHRSTLEIDFGGASEILGISPLPDSTTVTSILYYNPCKIEEIRTKGLRFHAQFRQQENLQVLRMFVITTLWGFFVALTFSSGWKALRVRSRRFRLQQKKEKEIEDKG